MKSSKGKANGFEWTIEPTSEDSMTWELADTNQRSWPSVRCQNGKKAQITEAILKQKVASNEKAEALYMEHREKATTN